MPPEQHIGNGQGGNGCEARASGSDPAPRTRKRRPACERCNKRRTRCDGWLVGTPCSGCKKSNNHMACVIIDSKRRRGADGRYVTHASSSPGSRVAASSTAEQSSPSRQSVQSDGSPALSIVRNGAVASSPSTRAIEARVRSGSDKNPRPHIVGESWYASYVMRGYRPGHASVHGRLDDDNNNAMVQSISEDMQTANETVHDSQANSSGPKISKHPTVPTSAAAEETGDRRHDLPAPDLVDRLVRAYFSHFHVFCPILVRSSFLSSLADGTISPALLHSVLFVASIHCDMETIHLLGYSSRNSANADLSTRATAVFDADKTSDRTSMFLSAYLLHYWFGSPSAYRDSHWWFAASVRSAQCMGYHLSTRHTQMAPEEKARWRRVWWCLYVRDRQISLSTGTPMVINDADYNVEELAAEDLSDESPETVRYLIGQLGLNKIAARLYFMHCSPLRLSASCDASVRENAMLDVQNSLETWKASQPAVFAPSSNGHSLTLTIKVCYNYYLINLTQRLQRQAPKSDTQPSSTTSTHIINAAAAVFGLVDDSLLYWTPEHFPMIYISALFSAMVVLAVDAAPPAERPNSEQMLCTIRPGLLALKQFEGVYVLARWIKNFFINCLGRWERDGRGTREHTPAGTSSRRDNAAAPHQASAEIPAARFAQTQSNATYMHPSSQGMGPALGLDALAGFMLDQDSGAQHGEAGRGEGAYWSGYLAGDTMGFPMPESSQYQAMYFLADLGMP